MTNAEAWASYVSYTKDLSDLMRKLGFGAAAVCWFFKSPQATFPDAVMAALMLVVLFFAMDMLQYLVAAVALRRWLRREEEKRWKDTGTIGGEYLKPASLDRIPYGFFMAKGATLLCAFFALGIEFAKRLG